MATRYVNPRSFEEKHIVRILNVIDTREWVEIEDDKWAPIPGSGDARECDRCGKLHEIHVYVELDDTSEAIVGSSCADSPTMEKAFRARVNLASKARKLELTLVKLYDLLKKDQIVSMALRQLKPPDYWEGDNLWWHMGDATVRAPFGFGRERLQALKSQWVDKRARELGSTIPLYILTERIRKAEDDLRKTRKAIK